MTAYNRIDQPEVTALLFPACSNAISPCPDYAEDVGLQTGAGTMLHCRYYCAAPEAPVLFYFPAAGCSVQSFDAVAQDYLKQGVSLFLVSYRGFDGNSGSPSVKAMYAAAADLFDLTLQWLTAKGCTGPVFAMGQSLGTVWAIDTVCKRGDLVKGLILESGICGTAAYLGAIGVSPDQAEIREEDGFNNLEKIEKIKVPTLIFHGAKDQLVPVAEAEKLQAASGAKTKQFFVIPGAQHHTIGETGGALYIRTIRQFLDTVCGVNTWRQKRKNYRSNPQDQRA